MGYLNIVRYIFANIQNIFGIFARMVEARGIETLSVSFTAGVILGAMLSGSSSMLPCTLLILIVLPCFLREKLLHLSDAQSLGILLATFLLLGSFCAWNALQPGVGLHLRMQD